MSFEIEMTKLTLLAGKQSSGLSDLHHHVLITWYIIKPYVFTLSSNLYLSLGLCLVMCQLGKLHLSKTYDIVMQLHFEVLYWHWLSYMSYGEIEVTCKADHRFAFTDFQQPPPRWCAISPTGPSTDPGLGNTCPKIWIPSCAPMWFMLSPSSTTKTSWLPMNGMTRPCTKPSMAWRASKNLLNSTCASVCVWMTNILN